MNEKHGPCLDKNCSWCCNPVKVGRGFPDSKIPKDVSGEPIWKKRDEMYIPEQNIDTVRLDTFDCNKLDMESGQCTDYENRPQICRNSGCLDKGTPTEEMDATHKRVIEQKFLIVNNPYKK